MPDDPVRLKVGDVVAFLKYLYAIDAPRLNIVQGVSASGDAILIANKVYPAHYFEKVSDSVSSLIH